MAVLVKPGVSFTFAPAMFRIVDAMKLVSRQLGIDLVITSGSDGVHSGPGDPHYSGGALDIRSHDLTMKEGVLELLLTELGAGFTGFIESPGGGNEHIHIQRRKGTVYTILDYLKG